MATTHIPEPRLTAAQVHVSLAEILAEGLKIQPRFLAEPRYARTGVGFMRSAGVSEMVEAKKQVAAGRGRR